MSTMRRLDKGPRPASVSSEILDRQPPCNVQAEQGVLGSIMLLPDVCDDVALILSVDDFYDDANRKLYEHMLTMHDAGRKIDLTLLVERLKTSGDYELLGGAAYLEKTFNSVANAAHARYYAEIVRDKSTYRSLITASTEILRDAYTETEAADEMLNSSEQKIFSIQDRRDASSVATMTDLMKEAMDRLDARMRGEHAADGVDTGFADLDDMLTGLHASQLVVLAARPGVGKTALALNVAEYISIHCATPVLYISLEMSTIELADRLLCSAAQVSSHKLRQWKPLSQKDRERLREKAGDMSNSPLYVDDTPGRRVLEIAASARRVRRKEGRLGLIIVDYLQLVEPDNSKDPRQEQVAKITRRLKLLSRDLKVPVMCLAQLNRQAEDGRKTRPRLSHLRESGAIEQDADVVLFIHRPELDQDVQEDRDRESGEAEIIIAKQRNGPVGDVKLTWKKEYTRFCDRALPHQEDFNQYNQGEPF